MPKNQWYIRGVDEATRRKIRAYAVANGWDIAQALKVMADGWLGEKK